jgi:DNA-binding transcriptional MerR regulator
MGTSRRARVEPVLTEQRRATMGSAPANSREIQLFEPPEDVVYTIEETSRLINVSRHTILVYCKHHLLSLATDTTDYGYYFDIDAIRALRRIEALRTVCGNDFAGIKIILDLTAALERLRRDIRLLSRAKGSGSTKKSPKTRNSMRRRCL